LARALFACNSEAISSLPVPVSPRTSTVTSFAATRVAVSSRRASAALRPMIRTPLRLLERTLALDLPQAARLGCAVDIV